jgi:predicted nucleotidyltransferase
MAQISNSIREKINRFSVLARQRYPIEKVLLYGSYAKGTNTADSDIDVAVVVNVKDHLKRIEITTNLIHCANEVDSIIEPKCVFADEYRNYDKASILSEILNTGIEIV